MKQAGFFDVDQRLARSNGLGDQLEAFSPTIADGFVRPDRGCHPGHHEDRAGQYRQHHAPLPLPREVERERVAIPNGTAPDLRKTQIESHPVNRQSERQKPEIISRTHQSTVLRSLQMDDRDHQAQRSGRRLCHPAKTLDRGAQLRMARTLLPPHERCRGNNFLGPRTADDRSYPQSSAENQSNRFLIQALNVFYIWGGTIAVP